MDIIKTIRLEPGHYVVAVSGGVDSMTLLDILVKRYPRKESDVRFTVAHFDHGIRDVSHIDRQLVQERAGQYKLPFVFEEGNLGSNTSEAAARKARYEFLHKVKTHTGARGVVTAHHLDDVIETAILNMMRGTGRKGMSSLKTGGGVYRPLAHIPKKHLRTYAQANGLVWHEDSTNNDQSYKRNFVRQTLVPKAKNTSTDDYYKLVGLIRRQRELNHAIDTQLETLLHTQPSRQSLRRIDVAMLPYKVANELVAEWLRQNGKRQLSRWLVDRLTVAIRTAHTDTELLLDSYSKVRFGKTRVEFINL
jgi:tRNA(Ile)-lysidine synthase